MGLRSTVKQFLVLLLIATSMQGAITRTQAVSANATNVAISSTTAGDLILVFAYNATSATNITLASGFTNLGFSGANLQAYRLAYKIAGAGETTSGTWTNATSVVCHVYRGTHQTNPIGVSQLGSTGNSASLTYSALSTFNDASGNSWAAGFGGAKAATAGMNGSTTNLTNRTSQTTVNGLDSGAGVSSLSGQTLNVTGSGRWYTCTVEIKVPSTVNTRSFFLLFP